jgi:hypothetical protein
VSPVTSALCSVSCPHKPSKHLIWSSHCRQLCGPCHCMCTPAPHLQGRQQQQQQQQHTPPCGTSISTESLKAAHQPMARTPHHELPSNFRLEPKLSKETRNRRSHDATADSMNNYPPATLLQLASS